jgi:hypothetical protein
MIVLITIQPEQTESHKENIAQNQTKHWPKNPGIIIEAHNTRNPSNHNCKSQNHETRCIEIMTQQTHKGIQQRDHRVQGKEEGEDSQVIGKGFNILLLINEHGPDLIREDEEGDVDDVRDQRMVLDAAEQGLFEFLGLVGPDEVVSQRASVTSDAVADVIHYVYHLRQRHPN